MPLPGAPTPQKHGATVAQGSFATASQTTNTQALAKLRPRGPFILMHHPNNWEVRVEGLDAPTWLPVLKQISISPGAGGVELEGNRVMHQNMVAKRIASGWVQIPEQPPYRREIKVARGIYNADAFERLEVYSDGGYELTYDHAAHNRWRLHLVESGVIPPIRTTVRDRLIKRLQGRLNRNLKNVHTPHGKAVVKDAEARIDAATKAAAPASQLMTAEQHAEQLAAERERFAREQAAAAEQLAAERAEVEAMRQQLLAERTAAAEATPAAKKGRKS